MSLSSWIKEFYPEPVNKIVNKRRRSKEYFLSIVDNSIKKWSGALPRNLKKHNVCFSKKDWDSNLYPKDATDLDRLFHFDGSTCSLCQAFEDIDIGCKKCPLYKVLGDQSCSSNVYRHFMNTKQVTPMLRKLKEARKYVEENY